MVGHKPQVKFINHRLISVAGQTLVAVAVILLMLAAASNAFELAFDWIWKAVVG